MQACVRVRAEVGGPSQDFAGGGLREAGNYRKRIEGKNKVVMISVDVKSVRFRGKPMQAVKAGHDSGGFLFEIRTFQLG